MASSLALPARYVDTYLSLTEFPSDLSLGALLPKSSLFVEPAAQAVKCSPAVLKSVAKDKVISDQSAFSIVLT